jgi:hypothetical protein
MSRDVHDTVIAELRLELDFERRRSEHLLDTVLDMKASGASVAARVNPNGPRLVRPTRSAVDQAIDENKTASSDPMLRSHLTRWAKKELEAGRDQENIVESLRAWNAPAQHRDDEDDEGLLSEVGIYGQTPW